MRKPDTFSLPAYVAFFWLGVSCTVVGPSVDRLSHKLHVEVSKGGMFVSAMFICEIISVLLTGSLMSRLNVRWILTGCATICGIGLVGTGFGTNLSVLLPFLGMIGVGAGGLSTCGSASFVRLFPDNVEAKLNILNFCYAPGAIFAPLALGFVSQRWPFEYAFIGVGVGLLVTAPFLLRCSLEPQGGSAGKPTVAMFRAIWVAMLAIGLYVGMEQGITTWTSFQIVRVAGAAEIWGKGAVALFWIGMALSRLVAPKVLKKLHVVPMSQVGALLVAVSVGMILAAPVSVSVALSASFLAGLGAGPLFPNVVALATKGAEKSGLITGVLVACGGLGAATLPYVQGRLGAGQDGGLIVPCITAVIVAALVAKTLYKQPKVQA